jgi:hypothetical protein
MQCLLVLSCHRGWQGGLCAAASDADHETILCDPKVKNSKAHQTEKRSSTLMKSQRV